MSNPIFRSMWQRMCAWVLGIVVLQIVSANFSYAQQTLFDNSALPAVSAVSDTGDVELGLQFVPGRSGRVTAIRFYRGEQGNGSYRVSLWDSTGTLLGRGAVFEGLAGAVPGWQQIALATPVNVELGKTYTASYFHVGGAYAFTEGGFTKPYYRGQLFAPANAGVYVYGNQGGFPTSTYRAASYSVDLVFEPEPEPPASAAWLPPQIFYADAVGSDAINVSYSPGGRGGESGEVLVRHFFQVDGQFAGVVPQVAGAGPARLAVLAPGGQHTVAVRGQAADGTFSAWTPLRNFTLPSPRNESTPGDLGLFAPYSNPNFELGDATPSEFGIGFTASVSGAIRGVNFYKGSLSRGPFVASLWRGDGTLLAQSAPTSHTGFGWRGISFASPVAIEAGTEYVVSYWAPNGYPGYSQRYFAGGGISYPPLASTTVGLRRADSSGFPNVPDANLSNFFVDPIFSSSSATTAVSLFAPDSVPANLQAVDDTARVELGVRVRPLVNGTISAIRFYRGVADNAGHQVNLWSSTGELLATAAAPSGTGWIEVPITPVQVQAGSIYVASYLAPNGNYAYTYERFTNAGVAVSNLIEAPSSLQVGGNGVYAYGGGFPTLTYRDSDYGVDIVFRP
jgi:Domain of unknown function (DUF4082)